LCLSESVVCVDAGWCVNVCVKACKYV